MQLYKSGLPIPVLQPVFRGVRHGSTKPASCKEAKLPVLLSSCQRLTARCWSSFSHALAVSLTRPNAPQAKAPHVSLALFEGTACGSKQRLEFALALHALKIIA